jgi:type VI secretion system protein ImpH
MRGRLQFPDEVPLFFSGYFANQTRNPASLEAMLAEFFRVPVEVRSFAGQWLYLAPAEQSVMGSALGRPAYNQLGVNVVVGERVWDVESKIRLRIGPVDYRTFLRFSPLGDRLVALCQLTRLYLRPQLDFDVQPVLLAAEVPGTRLGGSATSGSYLGWNSWVHSTPLTHDADEAVFTDFGHPRA